MMVIFVSQCEKKAILRTQKVLDAFAERLGDRIWQTLITEEGLQAVNRLLKKTASKNTAVACHWIRSRQRRDLLWVIGQQEKFNARGIVPVHYSETAEIKIDEIKIMTDKIYANTKKQVLDQHLFAVGYLAQRIVKRFLNDSKLAKTAFVAGGLHDIGKLEPGFQDWIQQKLKKKTLSEVPEEGQHIDKSGKFSFETHPRHNEVSLLLYHLLNDNSYTGINRANKDRIKHVIYWHHAKPNRKKEFQNLEIVFKQLQKNIGNNGLTSLIHGVRQIISNVNHISETYFEEDALKINGLSEHIDEYGLDLTSLPPYKRYSRAIDVFDYVKNIESNAQDNICRAAVISADRLVSGLDAESLNRYIEEQNLDEILDTSLIENSSLGQHIKQCLEGFENRFPNNARNASQQQAAEQLAQVEKVAALKGPAGCGKTKIALEWALNTHAKKIIWVCPRIQVCQGLFRDLSSSEYLPEAKIEICTGEFKSIIQNGTTNPTPENQEFSGDIVITTIDQIINTITTHKRITGLLQFMNAHVVFDEFHEYISMPAFNLLFAELVKIKSLQVNSGKALLVSATPNPFFLEKFLEIDPDDLIGIPSFNASLYQIKFETMTDSLFDEGHPLSRPQPNNSIVISNTAKMAQLSFIQNQFRENGLVYHSKFTRNDKESVFEKILDSFQKDGSRAYDILRSGPAVQASLNITSSNMVTEFTHAENWLQRLGRLDRFGENTEVNTFTVALPQSFAAGGKNSSKSARFLNQMFQLESSKAWHDFLTSQMTQKPVTINQLYALYEQFYQQDSCIKAVEADFLRALQRGVEILGEKLMDPVTFPRKNTSQNKIKKHSLRGDNRFVQMAVCQVRDIDDFSFSEAYAYTEDDLESNLTLSVESIKGYGNSNKNILSYMTKKHHNIKDTKKAYKDFILLNEARDPSTPIYTSYTPEDLEKVGGETARFAHAIYYAIGKKQPIGALEISDLQHIIKED